MTGACVRGPALDAAVIEGRAERPHPRLREWEAPLFEQVGHLVPPAPRVALDELLGDGDTLGWERPAEVLAAPGHTAGSVVVYFPENHVLIAGDAVATISGEPTTGVFNVDPDQAEDSLQRLAQLDVSILCVGHGLPITADAHARLMRAARSGYPRGSEPGAPRA
jgi:glyoxylase-like metal-dependent hydrolase (beta-lactamase superfamily II)